MADFTVHVQGFNVRKSEYQVKPSTTVRDLLDQVLKDSPGVASSLGHIKPIFRAKILVFHVPLSAYGIEEGDTIVLGRATTQLMRFADFEFSSNWNYDFTDKDDSGKKFTRGKYDYLRPIPYKRFGLHVKDRFDNGNNAWLREDAAAWPVAYFATGFDSKGDCLRTAGYVASTALAELPFDVPMAYFFSMDVKRVERFATSCVIDGKPCLVVVQARVNPEHIVELGDGIWAAKSADCFRPYGVLVKGDIQMTKSALLQAMNSLLPYVEILSETDYAARTKSGKESGAGDFSIPTCVPHLCIGGPLCTGKELEEVEGQEDEVVEVEWPTDVPHDLAKRVLDKNASDAIITKTANKYIVKGPRVDVHQAVSSLQAAMQSIGPAEWSSKGMKATLVPLKTDMTKFKHVSDRFHATASRAEYRIDAIEQIENRPLYTRFHKYRETVAIKCIPATRPQWDAQRKVDRELFYTPVHKVVDPATVYKGDVGFRRNDVPTSTPYGQGVTFASNAAVACTTNPFPAQNTPNQYQVILATVVTGVPQVVPAKKEFKEPDLMTDSVAEGDRYDCVQGPNADGAEVFVLYTDYAAYPTYLITYTKL